MHSYDVIVIGGGAAGLMSAIVAGKRGRRVVVLEGSNKIGKKILMSGGGRCNFTNLHCEPANFLSANPQFCISALSRYTQWDFIDMVQNHSIAYHEKSAGQLFCDGSSKEIVAMLREECAQANVKILTDCHIDEVRSDDAYYADSDKGQFKAQSLIVATGGLSIPKMGASDFGYRLAKQFGLKLLGTRAGLVPFTVTGATNALLAELAGVSLPVVLATAGKSFSDDLLFTHRGLSGPAALQLSSYWEPGQTVSINLLPQTDLESLLINAKETRPKSRLRSILSDILPRSLVIALQSKFWPAEAELPVAEISNDKLNNIANILHNWRLQPAGTEGYRTAEVTLGGVDTTDLSSQTMESRQHPGLFFIGEVVDVTGHLGGFNFQWAWASGHAAGQVA